MSVRRQANVVYGLSEALTNVPLLPIIANRPPGPNDFAAIGTIWVDKPQNIAYVLTSIVNNEATWVNITQSPGDFIRFTVQTADAMPTTLAVFPMASNSSLDIWANITAAQADFSGAGGWVSQVIYRRAGAGPIQVGAEAEIIANENFGGGNPEINFVVVGNTVELQVTGIAATVINWAVDVTTIIIT